MKTVVLQRSDLIMFFTIKFYSKLQCFCVLFFFLNAHLVWADEMIDEPLKVYCLLESENMKDMAPENFSSEVLELIGFESHLTGRHLVTKSKNYEFWVSSQVVVEQAGKRKIVAFKSTILDLLTGLSVSAHSASGEKNENPRRATVVMTTHEGKAPNLKAKARLEFDCFEYR
jgi:hypothetical protein